MSDESRRPSSTGQLDAISKKIVAALQRDGRTPYSTIARLVGLSEAAVRQRVQRLLDTGVVQIVAVTDPAQVGFTRQALIGVTISGDSQVVAEQLSSLEEVAYVVTTIGRYDLLVEVVCEDDTHLVDLLQKTIRGVPNVIATETFTYLKLNKQRYDWGTR